MGFFTALLIVGLELVHLASAQDAQAAQATLMADTSYDYYMLVRCAALPQQEG